MIFNKINHCHVSLSLFAYHQLNLCYQVGGDGCIFVWKVPAVMTSRMLQKIKENSRPLSPTTIAQCPTMNRIKFYEENYLRQRSADSAVVCEDNYPKETPTFRFSVSRLPHWAKSKVNSPLVIPWTLYHLRYLQINIYNKQR